MKIALNPGKYVVAVSGGVDSVVLLDLLYKKMTAQQESLIVAHFDHGIRSNSGKDCVFVSNIAKRCRLKFEQAKGNLGAGASEELARIKRYEFLNYVKNKYGADAIITAHHKDDVIETAVFNLLRGSGRRGLASLKSGEVLRPLLDYSKTEIINYAKQNKLIWVEDETNQEAKYTRNKIRKILENKSLNQKNDLNKIIKKTKKINAEIDEILNEYLAKNLNDVNNSLKREFFVSLEHGVALEILGLWLRKNKISYDRKLLNKLVVDLKVRKNGSRLSIDKNHFFEIKDKKICIISY